MEYKIKILSGAECFTVTASEGGILADVLSLAGVRVAADCGRRGVCSACKVKLIDGEFAGVTPDENGMIKSCRARVKSDASVQVNSSGSAFDYTDFSGITGGECIAAADIGTTTVTAAVLTADGRVFTKSALNPQSAFGADVLSRITACTEGRLEEMRSLILTCVSSLLNSLSSYGKPSKIRICGNTVMLHILCGESPEGIGKAPFTPVFTDERAIDGICGCPDTAVMPGISAFMGSDILAGTLCCLYGRSGTVLLADLGTNGELVLLHGGHFYCASTAVGPAFEGAGIECGTGGVDGAVSKAEYSPFGPQISVIGGGEPTGICGSGLTDCVAFMLSSGIIDGSGFMADEKYYIAKNVYISRADIRAFQNAKSAVCSGIETLCNAAGIVPSDIDVVLLAGGTGWWIDSGNAVKTGILPAACNGRIKAVGNSALRGALMYAQSGEMREKAKKIKAACTVVPLGGNEYFSRRFIENMNFGV